MRPSVFRDQGLFHWLDRCELGQLALDHSGFHREHSGLAGVWKVMVASQKRVCSSDPCRGVPSPVYHHPLHFCDVLADRINSGRSGGDFDLDGQDHFEMLR